MTTRSPFPLVYLENAGTSLNIFYPFFLTLFVAIFGVLMGAGGGFIMNPLLLALFPALPHTIVAGTVTPTVLFSQGSGIYQLFEDQIHQLEAWLRYRLLHAAWGVSSAPN